jgi:predicted glutamine amidotransferase
MVIAASSPTPVRWCRPDSCGYTASAAAGKTHSRPAACPIDAMEQDIMLFASVPLTDEAWEPLTEGEIIVVSEGCIVTPHSR